MCEAVGPANRKVTGAVSERSFGSIQEEGGKEAETASADVSVDHSLEEFGWEEAGQFPASPMVRE